MHRRTVLAGVASFPFANAALARGVSDTVTRTGDATLAQDVAILREAMAIHPGASRYLSAAALQRGLARFELDARRSTEHDPLAGRYLALSRFLTTLKCGHSYPNFFNQTDPEVKALFDRATRLPFHFEWIGRSMVVTADHSGTGALVPGTRVLAVNGQSAENLLDRLMPYARADGHNDGKRRSLLGVRGAEDIEYFDVFQGLLFPPQGGEHHLLVAAPDGRQRRVTVPTMTLAQRRSMMTRVPEDSDQQRWTYRVRPDGVAVLDMPGWAMWNSKWEWRGWLSDRLDDAASARGLVVDIRRNEGGDDCGDPILARIVERDLQGWEFEPRVRFRQVPPALEPHVSTWDDRFRKLGVGGTDLGGGWIGLPDREAPAPIRPVAKRLPVPVAVLIGPANSSATFAFVNAARASGKVKLFGEATGGNRRGINGGGFFFTTLPGSRIEFDLPLIGYFPRNAQPDAGIEPDVTVAATVASIASGSDPVMEHAARWALAEVRG